MFCLFLIFQFLIFQCKHLRLWGWSLLSSICCSSHYLSLNRRVYWLMLWPDSPPYHAKRAQSIYLVLFCSFALFRYDVESFCFLLLLGSWMGELLGSWSWAFLYLAKPYRILANPYQTIWFSNNALLLDETNTAAALNGLYTKTPFPRQTRIHTKIKK